MTEHSVRLVAATRASWCILRCVGAWPRSTYNVALYSRRFGASGEPTEFELRSPSPLVGNDSALPSNPMEVLTAIFKRHPSALNLHRELTIQLVKGDTEAAADLAGALAGVIRRERAAVEGAGSRVPSSTELNRGVVVAACEKDTELPAVHPEDITAIMDKTEEVLLESTNEPFTASSASRQSGAMATQPNEVKDKESLWHSSALLRVTVLECAFEAVVPDGEAHHPLTDSGCRAAAAEQQELSILEEYLEREQARWRKQKSAIAKCVVDVAQSLAVTPADLYAYEQYTSNARAQGELQESLNVLKHCNVIVRGEVPDTAPAESVGASDREKTVRDAAERELVFLKKRMADQGTPMSPREEEMALYELILGKSRMRYVVGLHRNVQEALNHSPTVLQHVERAQSGMESSGTSSRSGGHTGSSYFVDELVRALHRTPDEVTEAKLVAGSPLTVADVEAAEALMVPVLPFTFMMKCSLWFEWPTRPTDFQ